MPQALVQKEAINAQPCGFGRQWGLQIQTRAARQFGRLGFGLSHGAVLAVCEQRAQLKLVDVYMQQP